MVTPLFSPLSQLGSLSEPLGWLVLGCFLTAIGLEYVDREYARPVLTVGWVLFALFWLVLIYPYFAEDDSIVRGVGAVIAVPLSLFVAKSLYGGRDSLFTLSRAVAFTGLVYAPLVMVPFIQEQAILLVVDHTAWMMDLFGYEPPVVTELSDIGVEREIAGKETDYRNSFVFMDGRITYSIIVACTGIGSMAVVIGLILAVRAPPRRKLRALAIAVPIIYFLNIVRNVFIGVSYGHQYAHFFPDITMWLFSLENPLRVSYIWADRIVAQFLAVGAMMAIIWLVMRELPEVTGPLEDILYLLTGEEYDLVAAFDIDVPDDIADEASQSAD